MMMLYSCHPEVMIAIQRWLVDSLRLSRGLKCSSDVRRESTTSAAGSVTLHPVTLMQKPEHFPAAPLSAATM